MISETTHGPVNLDEEFQRLAQQARQPARTDHDPGITVERVAHDRARKLVDELKTGGLSQLTELRDTLDDLMRAINAKADEAERQINELAMFVTAAMEMADTVKGPINEQARIVSAGLKPAPGKTVTAR